MLFKLMHFVFLVVGLWEESEITNTWWFMSKAPTTPTTPTNCESNSGVA